MGWTSRLAVLVGGMLVLSACGAPPPPAEPPAQPQYAPQPYPAPPGVAPAPSAPPMPGSGATQSQVDVELATMAQWEALIMGGGSQPGPAAGLSADRCQRLCAALGSMRRSVENVCRLTGEGDARCSGARNRLKNSEQRVTDAGCTC